MKKLFLMLLAFVCIFELNAKRGTPRIDACKDKEIGDECSYPSNSGEERQGICKKGNLTGGPLVCRANK